VANALKVQVADLGPLVLGTARNAREAVPSTLRPQLEPVIAAVQLPIIDGTETARGALAPMSALTACAGADLVR
jgi:hypothetical protein